MASWKARFTFRMLRIFAVLCQRWWHGRQTLSHSLPHLLELSIQAPAATEDTCQAPGDICVWHPLEAEDSIGRRIREAGFLTCISWFLPNLCFALNACVYMWACMHVCACLHACVGAPSVYVHLCAGACACMCVLVCMHTCIRVYFNNGVNSLKATTGPDSSPYPFHLYRRDAKCLWGEYMNEWASPAHLLTVWVWNQPDLRSKSYFITHPLSHFGSVS